MGDILGRIRGRPHMVVVRGLRFDEGNRLFVALNRAMGNLVAPPYNKPRAQLIHYIEPSTDIPAADGIQTESERLHTDSADWPRPVDTISMQCVRPDSQGGGRSRLIDIDTVKDELTRRLGLSAVAELEQTPVPWELAAYLGGGIVWEPVLGSDRMRWRRYTIEAALRRPDVKIPTETITLLDRVGQVLGSTDRFHAFLMRAGDLLISDNRRTLHAREPVVGGRERSRRLMLRSWIEASPVANTLG